MTHSDVLNHEPSVALADTLIRPVLVALKPFDGSDNAIAMARWLVERHHTELQGMSVIEMGDMGTAVAGLPPLPEEYYRRERDEVATDLQKRLGSPGDHGPARVDVVEGAPGSSIARAAAERHASVIVIGTGRHGRLGRFLYGERALDVVRNAEGPVLVVPPTSTTPIERAVVAVDFSQASVRAAIEAMDMLNDGGHLVLVHVEKAPHHFDERGLGVQEECERRTRTLFSCFLDALPSGTLVRLDTVILRGDPAGALLRYVEEHDVQLLACGRRRHSLVERFLVGSVSTALIRGASCCVLVAPERAGDEEPDARLTFGETRSITNPDEWRGLLHEITAHNTGRKVRVFLEASSPGGIESVDRNYQLLAVDYDRRGERVDIVLGDPHVIGSHVSHRLTGIQKMKLVSEPDGRFARVEFDTRSGRCTLDFVGP
jgi:nucleotide-binding universal stress UspA family protein